MCYELEFVFGLPGDCYKRKIQNCLVSLVGNYCEDFKKFILRVLVNFVFLIAFKEFLYFLDAFLKFIGRLSQFLNFLKSIL